MKDVLTLVKRRSAIFMLACLGTAAMVFISEGSYRNSVATLDELGRFATARVSILALTRGLVDAETGQRGYLLTGRKEYLRPYDRALGDVATAFDELNLYYGHDPAHRTSIGRLRELTDANLAELALSIRLLEQGQPAQATLLVLGDVGRQKTDAIRTIGDGLLAHESSNLVRGRSDLDTTLMLSRIGVALLSAVSLMALFLYLRQTAALEQQQLIQQQLVQAERDRLEAEVAQRTLQLTQLARHLQSAREDERNRLARDLHDELGALLTSAKLDAARIRSRLSGLAPEALERLAHLVSTLDQIIALKRRIAEDLRPSALSNLGLVATLEILAREFAERSGVEVHCSLNPVPLSASAELSVYRLVQEAITNLSKYAQAKHVWLSLAAHHGEVEVSVRDDGVGFEAGALTRASHGLLGMRFRVEAEGGTLGLVSAPGQGTRVTARLPESAPAAVPAAVPA